ncbi:hypothetical protein CRE_15826 [Caenorhabditis remanei]|uniref:Uncharacterized protein n=1 Tax=Caenorhabditis remanei TaxID=31234 RepID=E3NR20_CAERE|nr:hypothetical protein CRE_15826 [Caenorhabditis remanei]
MSKNCKSAENTDDDRTLAEDDQNDQNSGSMDHRFERITVTLEKVGGKKFGLGIASVHQRILVCKVENGGDLAEIWGSLWGVAFKSWSLNP